MVKLRTPDTPAGEEAQEVQQILFPYGIGIDTHSKFIQVCVLIQTHHKGGGGVTRHEATFKTHWPALVEARDWAFKLVRKWATRDSLRYCIESTGCYHLPVLKAWRGTPAVVNPLLAGATRRKTDVLDARLLAHHSITGLWKVSYVPTEQTQQLRVLWAQRQESARNATRHSNRINNIILRFGHTLGSEAPMRSAEAEGLIDDLVHGRVPMSPVISPDGLPKQMRPVIGKLYDRMKDASTETKLALGVTKKFIETHRWPTTKGLIAGTRLLEILQTVPGVGLGTSISWLSEIGDPGRFAAAKQVAAYCGCDPSLKVSAGKVTSMTRRAGNARLHNALNYAAQAVMQRPQLPLAQWGRSIAGRHKKGGYRKAAGAVTRRIACSLWHVHRLGEEYDESHYRFDVLPRVPDVALGDVVGKRYHPLLKDAGISTSQELAGAYVRGELAKLRGFGAAALDAVQKWVIAHRQHERMRKTMVLDSKKRMKPRKETLL